MVTDDGEFLIDRDGMPSYLRLAEEAALHGDYAQGRRLRRSTFRRPATEAELLLLRRRGYDPSDNLKTIVRLRGGCRVRLWPALRDTERQNMPTDPRPPEPRPDSSRTRQRHRCRQTTAATAPTTPRRETQHA